MIVTASPSEQASNGPRPINLQQDFRQVLQLLEIAFGGSLDAEGQRMLTTSSEISRGPSFLWRLDPTASKLALGFVWEVHGRIVGNATLLTTRTPGRYLVVNVAVHPDYRRQGIARGLMQQLAIFVRQRYGREILLQVVKENKAAVELYRSLNYVTIGSMTSWYSTPPRLRHVEPFATEPGLQVHEMRTYEWRDAFRLDQTSLHPDLNWPELLPPDVYKNGIWQQLNQFLNGRGRESWVTRDGQQQLTGLLHIATEWGQPHYALIRVHPAWRGRVERPLVNKMVRRLENMPRRNIRIDHPDDDDVMNELLHKVNFGRRRTLTHMRLNL